MEGLRALADAFLTSDEVVEVTDVGEPRYSVVELVAKERELLVLAAATDVAVPGARPDAVREALDRRPSLSVEQRRMVERLTVGEFLATYLTTIRPVVRPSTYRSYEQNIRLYLIPTLGRRRLAKLTPQDVQAFLDALSKGQWEAAREMGTEEFRQAHAAQVLQELVAKYPYLRKSMEPGKHPVYDPSSEGPMEYRFQARAAEPDRERPTCTVVVRILDLGPPPDVRIERVEPSHE